MSGAALNDLQYELGDTIFGRDTSYQVEQVQFGQPNIRTQDVDRARADSRRFGRDYKSGRTITFDMHVLVDPSLSLDALDTLWAQWTGDDIRTTPGATTTLRWSRGGRTRRVYGRPREFLPVTGTDKRGWVPVTATFATRGPYFYDDTEQSIIVDFAPPTGSGFTAPFTSPITFTGENPSQGSFTIDSPSPLQTPITLRIDGPIIDPRIVIDNDLVIELSVDIASDDYALVDPIDMTIISKFGQNWAGKLTPESTYLSDLYVGPGQHVAVLTGTDSTATSSITVSWRTVHASY